MTAQRYDPPVLEAPAVRELRRQLEQARAHIADQDQEILALRQTRDAALMQWMDGQAAIKSYQHRVAALEARLREPEWSREAE